jgi:hypothetical protein
MHSRVIRSPERDSGNQSAASLATRRAGGPSSNLWADSPRMTAQQQTLQAMFGPAAVVVQREAVVDDDETKLQFFVERFSGLIKDRFTNADEDKRTAFMRDVSVAWDGAYAGNENRLDLGKAKQALKMKALLLLLGKADPASADYERLSLAVSDTFADDADNLYALSTRVEKFAAPAAGTDGWLTVVDGEGLIEAEDKTGDDRLVNNASQDHIVKTGADTADSATALFVVHQDRSAEDEIASDERSWELHGHVRQNGNVDFAHTKANGAHAKNVTGWFRDHIDVTDRTWSA